jgi:hypothetical protein
MVGVVGSQYMSCGLKGCCQHMNTVDGLFDRKWLLRKSII